MVYGDISILSPCIPTVGTLTLALEAAASTVEGSRRHTLGLPAVGDMHCWVEPSTEVPARLAGLGRLMRRGRARRQSPLV